MSRSRCIIVDLAVSANECLVWLAANAPRIVVESAVDLAGAALIAIIVQAPDDLQMVKRRFPRAIETSHH